MTYIIEQNVKLTLEMYKWHKRRLYFVKTTFQTTIKLKEKVYSVYEKNKIYRFYKRKEKKFKVFYTI